MPIDLSKVQQLANFEDRDVITEVATSGKIGPPVPLLETHPIQTVGVNVSAQGDPLPRISGQVTASADMTMSYVSNRFQSLLPTISSLPPWSDDISERFGPEIYDRMYKDSEVAASLDMLVAASTSQDIRFIPGIEEGKPGHKKAKRIADFFTWMTDEYMDSVSFDEVRASAVTSALRYGNNITEMTMGVVNSGPYRNFIAAQYMRDAEIREYSLVVDNFNNLIGVVPAVNRQGIGGETQQLIGSWLNKDSFTIKDLQTTVEEKKKLVDHFKSVLVPRRKFIMYTWRPIANDPRGVSALRPAYAAWWLKQQVINEMLSWLEKFSQPSVVGATPEGAVDQCFYDAQGNVTERITPTTQLLGQLKTFQSSSALAVPYGTKIDLLTSTGQGQVFLSVLQYANQEIARAVLKQHLATSEGIHQSRAASDVHQDILSLVVIGIKNWQKRILMRDFVRPLVELNFSRNSLKFAPKIDIGDGDGFPLNPFEVSQLQGVGWFSPSQRPAIDQLLGLPVRSESIEEMQRLEEGNNSPNEPTANTDANTDTDTSTDTDDTVNTNTDDDEE